MDKVIKVHLNKTLNSELSCEVGCEVSVNGEIYLSDLINNLTQKLLNIQSDSPLYSNVSFLFLGTQMRYLFSINIANLYSIRGIKLKDAIVRTINRDKIQDIQYCNMTTIHISTSLLDWTNFTEMEEFHCQALINHTKFIATSDQKYKSATQSFRRKTLSLIQDYVSSPRNLENICQHVSRSDLISNLIQSDNYFQVKNQENEEDKIDQSHSWEIIDASEYDDVQITNDLIAAMLLDQELNQTGQP